MGIFDHYKGLRKELYILFLGRIMTNMGSMIWPMFTLILNQKLGLSAGTIATYMLVFSIASMPILYLGGKLADKFNKKNIIVICDFISIASYIYCSFVPISFTSMLIFCIASLFQSIEGPSYDALVADCTTSKDRDAAYSLSYLGNNLGLVLSPTIGGLLFNSHLNLAFLINGVSILVSTVLIMLFIHDIHREKDDSKAGIYETEIDEKTSAFSYLKTNKVIILFIIMGALTGAVYNMWGYLMPMELAAVHGDSGPVIYGTITSVNCIEVVLITSFITRIFFKTKEMNKMFIGESLILGGYLIFMLLKSSILMCYVSIIVFTFGEILNTISSSPFLTRRIPASHRGRIMSIMGIVTTLSGSLIQKVIGNTYDSSSSTKTWILVIITGLTGLLLNRVISIKDKKDYPDLY